VCVCVCVCVCSRFSTVAVAAGLIEEKARLAQDVAAKKREKTDAATT